MRSIAVAALFLAGLIGQAAAETPVAVIEDVQGKVTGAEFMDYVAPGKVIKLGDKGSIVISYMKSCWRETISGIGTVIVGHGESMVHLSDVKGEKAECDTAHLQSASRQTSESAATVVRSIAQDVAPAAAPLTLYGLSPIIETTGHGTLVIERTDVKGEREQVALNPRRLVHGRFYDLAREHKSLSPGASYVASSGGAKVAFRIDPGAQPGATPVVGRLVRLH